MNRYVDKSDLRNKELPWAVIIAGPTCSGKSYLALKIAQALQGTIINADAMQCYRDLRIITTRPSVEDEACVPHRLYGVLSWDQTGNAGWWRGQAITEMQQVWDQQRLPILCGGTGMYFHSLIHGIAMIPEPSAEAREEARRLINIEGSSFLHDSLLKVDPQTAKTLKPTDSQRVARAWEVWRSTGKGLKYWQQEAHIPGIDCRFIVIRLAPERAVLKEAVAQRFMAMVEEGAIKEVEGFLEADPPEQVPLRRALGVPEFTAYLENKITLLEAIEQAVRNTQRYIKRQETWFSNKELTEPQRTCIFNSRIDSKLKFSERFVEKSILFINSFVDVS